MNDLIEIKIGDISILDIIKNPDNYPEEIIAASYDAIDQTNKYIHSIKLITEQILIRRMTKNKATKLVFKDNKGQEHVATLKKGSMKCDKKDTDAENIVKAAGFDPLQIGDYKYVPSWSKAKEARKLGGELQTIIDKLFREGSESIKID